MKTLVNLEDLLQHEIKDLSSAEDQIIKALPDMISKAKNPALKKALQDHLTVTKEHLKRLNKVQKLMHIAPVSNEKKGILSKIFGEGEHKCKGTAGLIEESQKMMKEDMSPEVMDAAIIAGAQKIEHYEISGYGTARAFAKELKMGEVVQLLEKTLMEEYQSDDLLTALAVGHLNIVAENPASQNGKENGMKKQSSPTKAAGKVVTPKKSQTPAKRKSPAKETKKTAVKK